jgi:hypothetical protein
MRMDPRSNQLQAVPVRVSLTRLRRLTKSRCRDVTIELGSNRELLHGIFQRQGTEIVGSSVRRAAVRAMRNHPSRLESFKCLPTARFRARLVGPYL